MNRLSNRLLALPALLMVGCLGCDAPRDNPLDPGSEHYIPPAAPDRVSRITGFSVKTEHIAANLPDPEKTIVHTEAEIIDPDGVQRVYLEVADSLRYIMVFNSSIGRYMYSFKPEQAGYNINRFIGASFRIHVYDRAGNVTTSDRAQISRVLQDLPEIVRPTADRPADSRPTLVWKKYFANFSFLYKVQIRTIAGTVTFEESDITPKQIVPGDTLHYDSLAVTDSLADGQYLWNVWVFDVLGNQSRSTTQRFIVNSGAQSQQPFPGKEVLRVTGR